MYVCMQTCLSSIRFEEQGLKTIGFVGICLFWSTSLWWFILSSLLSPPVGFICRHEVKCNLEFPICHYLSYCYFNSSFTRFNDESAHTCCEVLVFANFFFFLLFAFFFFFKSWEVGTFIPLVSVELVILMLFHSLKFILVPLTYLISLSICIQLVDYNFGL